MDIKLDHYKIFFEVANNLSFSRAAEQLFLPNLQSASLSGI